MPRGSHPGACRAARCARALAVVLLAAATAAAAGPRVDEVSPPDWWQATRVQSLRLLLTGVDLGGVRARVTPRRFQVGALSASADGHYLFLTLRWTDRPAAQATISLAGPGGRTELPFRFRSEPAPAPQGFGPSQVIYLIMVDRFARGRGDAPSDTIDRAAPRAYHGGDFLGIEQHLDYLRALGIGAIWLTPLYQNGAPTDYHGYGAVDEYRVEDHFGGMEALRALVTAAHARGVRVVQDQVANHTGPTHPWVRDEPTPTWFHGTPLRHAKASFDYARLADPYAAPALGAAVTDGWFAGTLPDLNQGDPEVARYEIQNSLWWLGMTGMDGIREDTFPMVPCAFWQAWLARLRSSFPRVNVVGEVTDPRPWVTAYFERDCAAPPAAVSTAAVGTGGKSAPISLRAGRLQARAGSGSGLTVFDYPLYFVLRRVFIGGADFSKITDVLAQDGQYRDPNRLVTFLGNHDVPRFLTEAHGSIAKLQAAFTFLLTVRGTPMIYYGDEIGMTGGRDPYNRHDFPGGFPGDAHDAFTAAGRDAEQNAVFTTVQRLLRLRQEHAALRVGDLKELLVAPRQLAYLRRAGTDKALVAFNNAAQPAEVNLDLPAVRAARWRPALLAAPLSSRGTVTLPAYSAQVFVTY